MENETQSLMEVLQGMVTSFQAFAVNSVPRIISGLALLLIGWILAKLIQLILSKTLKRLRFDDLMERVGISEALGGIGVKGELSQLLPRLLYVFMMILFVQASTTAMGLTAIADAITAFFGYLPNIITAILVLLMGNLVAGFAAKAITESGRDNGLDYAPALGRAVGSGIMLLVAIMAISQLGIDTDLIHTVVIIALASGALGFALSFGLGSREATRNVVAGFYARKLLVVGEEIEVDGLRGILAGVTATTLLIEADGKMHSVANAHLHTGIITQSS